MAYIDLVACNFRINHQTKDRTKSDLEMNAAKTKYMKGNDPKDDNLRLPPFIRVDGVELEEMKEFVYFESLMTAANDTSDAFY